jgi:hypothetical protein
MRFQSKQIELTLLPVSFVLGVLYVSLFPGVISFCTMSIILLTILIVISNRMSLFDDMDMPKTKTIHNQTLESAIKEIDKLLNVANQEVVIVSGGLNHHIWNNNAIINDLNSILNKDINVEILIGPHLNCSKHSEIYKYLKQRISHKSFSLYKLDKRPDAHFIIIDNAHIRLEKNHDQLKTSRQALIKYYAVALAGRAKAKYEDYRLRSLGLNEVTFNELSVGELK